MSGQGLGDHYLAQAWEIKTTLRGHKTVQSPRYKGQCKFMQLLSVIICCVLT